MKKLLLIGLIFVLLVGAVPVQVASACCDCEPHSPGYWKNHPDEWSQEAWRPDQGYLLNGIWVDKTMALDLMNRPVAGDKSITLFKAWAAAMNVCYECRIECASAQSATVAAKNWLSKYLLAGVRGNSDAWKEGEPIYLKLDYYVNGNGCP